MCNQNAFLDSAHDEDRITMKLDPATSHKTLAAARR